MSAAGRAPLAFFLPSLTIGGAESVMVNLAIGFAERGVPTDLVLASAHGPYLRRIPSVVRIIDLKVPRVLWALFPLVAYLRRERPLALLAAPDHADVIAMAASRISRVRTRTVISVHGTIRKSLADRISVRERAVPRLLARLHHWADAIVAVSKGAADDFAELAGIPRDRVHVIYNAVITPALLRAASEPAAHPWFDGTGCPVVLGVGRLASGKNFGALIDAFAIVRREREARLVILGEGPERPALEALVRHHGVQDSVALPGFVDNPYACMARASVVVVSSDWEGLPTVLIESLAVGTPVVSTDCPSGPREILVDGALGTLVPIGDIGAMADAIVRALSIPRVDPPWDALHRFTPDIVLDQYRQVLGLV